MSEIQKSVRGEIEHKSPDEVKRLSRLQELTAVLAAQEDVNWQGQSHLTLSRLGLSRILYFNHLYQLVLGKPGVILEFGVQWGASLALLSNLRGIYEPYNYTRTIVGFDTFSGFPTVHAKDGSAPKPGDYSVAESHVAVLEEILTLHESASPIANMRKHELVVGDVVQTLPVWLEGNPQAIASMVIFDMDLYEPTKVALELILPRLTRGSVVVFDELNAREWPGETRALSEVLGLDRLRLQSFPHQPRCAWGIWGE